MLPSKQTKLTSFFNGFHIAGLAVAMLCTLIFLSQTVFAQNTYVITDGTNVQTYVTYETDPAIVLNEAGVTLDENDIFSTEHTDGVYEITISRSHTVTVDHAGTLHQVESYGETVGQLLSRLNIVVNSDTILSEAATTVITDDMWLTVDYLVHNTETYTVVVPYETEYYEDDSLPAGMEVVITEGRDGQVERTALVTYQEGKELVRLIQNEIVLEESVTQVVAVGTGEPQDVEAQGGLIIGNGIIITADGQVLTYTGTMQARASAYTHTDAGCDMITSTGTTVRIGTVAVDPRVIPYGTRMFIVTNDGSYVYGIATAEDCGSAIKNDRVDLYFPTTYECFQFGRRDCTIYFLG